MLAAFRHSGNRKWFAIIMSVAGRLGQASMTTTQKTYLHIIQELENKDVDLVMRTLILLLKIFPKVVIWILRH